MYIKEALLILSKPLVLSTEVGDGYKHDGGLVKCIADAVSFARAANGHTSSQVLIALNSSILERDREDLVLFIERLVNSLQIGGEKLNVAIELIDKSTLKLSVSVG